MGKNVNGKEMGIQVKAQTRVTRRTDNEVVVDDNTLRQLLANSGISVPPNASYDFDGSYERVTITWTTEEVVTDEEG